MRRKLFSKGLLSILLATVMLTALLPMSAMAEKNSDQEVTADSFILRGYEYGKFTSTCNAISNEQWTTIVREYAVLEYIDNEYVDTADWYFNADKQYYFGMRIVAHQDSAGFADSFAAQNVTLNLNGKACELVSYDNYQVDKETTYEIIYKLPVLKAVPMEINYTFDIKQGGSVAPVKAEFELEVLNTEEGSNSPIADYTIGGKTVSTEGEGGFDSKLTVGNNDFGKLMNLLRYEGIYVRQKKGNAEGWTYDESVWAVILQPEVEVNALNDDKAETEEEYIFNCVKGKLVDGEFVPDSDSVESKMTFTNTYTANHTHEYTLKHDAKEHWNECECGDIQSKEAHKYGDWKIKSEATDAEEGEREHTCSVCGYTETEKLHKLPKAGDDSNTTLMIALLLISAFGVGTSAYSCKAKSVR